MTAYAAISACMLAVWSGSAAAHHDVETTIAGYTARIDSGETGADLYYQRATEYRVLRKPAEAEADLRTALEQDAAHASARGELARLLAARGEYDDAIEQAGLAAEYAKSDHAKAAALVLMARLLADADRTSAALDSCAAAFALRPKGDVEWFLLRSDLLGELGRGKERPATLSAGYASTGSIVLRKAWIDALLDSGDADTALPIIEKELASSRLKSSWLLRRARARLLNDQEEPAAADLRACLAELADRIHPARPDLTLIADRGLAKALLGETESARADLARARAAGADRWTTATLERQLTAK